MVTMHFEKLHNKFVCLNCGNTKFHIHQGENAIYLDCSRCGEMVEGAYNLEHIKMAQVTSS